MKKIISSAVVLVALLALLPSCRSPVAAVRKAAEQGNAEAQYELGLDYMAGSIVHQDFDEAMKWLRKAAEQGYARAQFNLGVVYEVGRGVPKDLTESAKWYRKAAEQGDACAQRQLEIMEQDKKK